VRWIPLLVGVACGGAGVRPPPPPPPEAVAGLWSIADGSDVHVRISLGAPQPALAVVGDAFEVSAVSFDGRRLRATFRHLPNGVTTTSDLTLVSANRLEGTVSGAYAGRETWLRVTADAGP
jgi:hypothetical protein